MTELQTKGDNPQFTVLLVDDEENILSSLKRLFRSEGYKILTALRGEEGVKLLEQNQVDIVISDMRMPGMTGAELLRIVNQRWPETVRILLTGFADLESAISAINDGKISKYISKPWDDGELKNSVKQALRLKYLEGERKRLEDLTKQQNDKLMELNATLEQRVKARTEEIQQTADMLDLAYREIKRSYVNAIPVFANLIELREGASAGHGRRVAELARAVAGEMGVDEEGVENIYIAGLLHDIGQLGMPDQILAKSYTSMTQPEVVKYKKHPILGQAALMALDSMEGVGVLIRHHHEQYNGKGYPDELAGEQIPLGARILSVISDYDALQLGALVDGMLTVQEARSFLQNGKGKRYDPTVVDAFLQWLEKNPQLSPEAYATRVASGDLEVGMKLAKDLINKEGMLLLSEGHVLDERNIERIRTFERHEDHAFTIFIDSRKS